jgi:heavy metal sensor kinase
MRLSVRWRLTLWNTLALAVLLLGFSGLVYALMRHALYEQVDRSLLAELRQLQQDERLQGQPGERLAYWIEEFLEHEKNFCIVYQADGTVYRRTQELAAASVPADPGPATVVPRFSNQKVPIIGWQRALTTRLKVGSQEVTVLQLAPLMDVEHELQELQVALGMAVPATLILSAGLGYALARKALKPMEKLQRRTAEITAEQLDRRLPVDHPRDEVGRLAQTINGMIARLERSFGEVRRFTADASHELRTPLTVIRSEAELALGKDLSVAEYQTLLGSILEECDRLTRLTEQLLALAREDGSSSSQPLQPLDLAALVEGVVENMRPLAEMKGLVLRQQGQGPLVTPGDETRLRQVFYNLLDNAIKYTPEDGTITVRLGRQEGSVTVAVCDTGIGIAAEHLPRVFDRFYRVDKGRSREMGGTGLGLSIVQSIVNAHQGRIDLASTLGQGTTCTVVLPEETRGNTQRTGEM